MADPTLTNSGSNWVDNSASPSASFGFTGTSGRLLVVCWIADDYITAGPSGFTQAALIGSAESAWFGLGVWYKISAGTESSTSVTLSNAADSAWAVMEFDSVDGTPLDGTPQKAWAAGTVATYTSPSITPSSGRRMVLTVIGGSANYNAAITGFSGWTNSYTERKESLTTGTAGAMVALGAATLTLDGGSATSTNATYDGNQAISAGAISVSFKVAADNSTAAQTAPVTALGLVLPAEASGGVAYAPFMVRGGVRL